MKKNATVKPEPNPENSEGSLLQSCCIQTFER